MTTIDAHTPDTSGDAEALHIIAGLINRVSKNVQSRDFHHSIGRLSSIIAQRALRELCTTDERRAVFYRDHREEP